MGDDGLHSHADGQTVKGVHQADGKSHIAYLFGAEMRQQRLIDVVFGMRFGNVGQVFSPGQGCTLRIAEVITHSPACQRIQFALIDTGFTQRLTVHLKAKCAAVNL